jgi:hypothetical protein
MTEEGFLKTKELFEQHFVKETKTIPFPKLTPPAKKRWEQIPEQTRKDILENVWSSQCRTMVALQLREEGTVVDVGVSLSVLPTQPLNYLTIQRYSFFSPFSSIVQAQRSSLRFSAYSYEL